MEKKQHQKETRLSREKQEKIEEEHVKVYSMPLDVRHWRIAVFGLIDSWELGQMLGRGRGSGNKDEEIWAEISKLSIEECQRLLLKKAVDEGLTSRGWGNEFFKEWIVKEFGLTPALFLKEDE